MACITLFAQPLAMATTTTQLKHMVHDEVASIMQLERILERKPLSMSWVVVIGSNGSRQLQIQWTPSADLR